MIFNFTQGVHHDGFITKTNFKQMKTVLLFPGQGAQQVGMLHQFPLNDECVAEVFKEVEEVLSIPVYSLDTEEKLRSTIYVQLCLLIAGVISARRLISKGVKVDFVAGHSVGAFAAAVISGVLTFKQALQLVDTRGILMQEAYPKGYGMAAVIGFSASRLQTYIDLHNQKNTTVYLSNINSADQQVVAGATDSLNVLISSLQNAGARKAQLLNMAVPSHCELLADVAAALHRQISPLELGTLRIPYISNHTGRLLKNAEAVRTDLWKSVAATVKWYDGTSLLYELGARIFIEMEPAGVLAKMAETAFPEATVMRAETDKNDTLAWLWKNYQEEQF